MPEPDAITFVTPAGAHLGDYPSDEIAGAALALAAALLKRPGDTDHARELIVGLTLLEGVPAPLVLGETLRLVVDVLGRLARTSPAIASYLSQLARTLGASLPSE